MLALIALLLTAFSTERAIVTGDVGWIFAAVGWLGTAVSFASAIEWRDTAVRLHQQLLEARELLTRGAETIERLETERRAATASRN